ncbi:MAG: hybrid sensor histidine kinase/response regulator, partial [Lachnospiraceae bacterium]|nr:hybrid sensor histidine kinase/response regulator [Lachnospiraceae bacterium]
MKNKTALTGLCTALICLFTGMTGGVAAYGAEEADRSRVEQEDSAETRIGGGYAATGQLQGIGYTATLYDATNGLPTSDANWILGASDGYVWIGGYSGIIRYDGSTFERLDSSDGLTSGRVIFEDSRGRIWVGTNDNGVVVMDGNVHTHYTYKDGLISSSIRSFAEDNEGNIYIGSTSGLVYAGTEAGIRPFSDERLSNKTIECLQAASDGRIYGCTSEGEVFCISSGNLEGFYTSGKLGVSGIKTLLPDPEDPEKVYLGTTEDCVYYGVFGQNTLSMQRISTAPARDIVYIAYACGRIWITSDKIVGYLDSDRQYHTLKNLPMNNSIWMLTQDYQGNLWIASSRQGVMKVVSNNFEDITEEAGLPETVVNSTCLRDGLLYIGADDGLYILDDKNRSIENSLTDRLAGIRIRCISRDRSDNLWISTYSTEELGLICYDKNGNIKSYNKNNGMVDNWIRCTDIAEDGSVLVGTGSGLNVIKDGEVVRTVGASEDISNTVFLTVEEGEKGEIYVGTDGDGIYIIKNGDIEKLGRDDGLTSDVILRIKKDEKRDIYWIVTSNSIEYIKDGEIKNVSSFPYSNNFDIYFAEDDNIWILSSYGVYVLKAQDAIDDKVTDYRLYTIANGLPGTATANSFSELDEEGNLYISCRTGVSRVNINHYFEQSSRIRLGIRSLICNEE